MFEAKKIRTKTVGDELREARNLLNFSLKEVSRQINIPVNYLEQIETGNYDNKLADVYLIGYLKKYAQLLELDPVEIVNKFKKEKGIKKQNGLTKERKSVFKKVSLSNKPVYITPKRITLVLAIVFIGLIFGYFWRQLSYVLFPPEIEVFYPESSEAVVYKDNIEIYGKTDQGTQVTINGKRITVDNNGCFRKKVYLNEGLNNLVIEAKDLLGRKHTINKKVIFIKSD